MGQLVDRYGTLADWAPGVGFTSLCRVPGSEGRGCIDSKSIPRHEMIPVECSVGFGADGSDPQRLAVARIGARPAACASAMLFQRDVRPGRLCSPGLEAPDFRTRAGRDIFHRWFA